MSQEKWDFLLGAGPFGLCLPLRPGLSWDSAHFLLPLKLPVGFEVHADWSSAADWPELSCSLISLLQWFTPEGFRSLFALVGTNGQGIGTR